MKKKRKLKKKFKVIFIIFILITISLCLFLISNKKNNSATNRKNKEDLVETIYSKLSNYDISKEFINWVNSNYSGSLNKLDKLLKDNAYNKNMWHEVTGYSYIVLNDLYNDRYSEKENIKTLEVNWPITLSFAGDVSLADNWKIAPKYDERGGIKGILSDDMLDIMTNSSLMVVNSEFTVSNRGNPIPNKLYTFRAKPERLAIYEEMGVDLVTLANNHVYDYGKEAFLDMLDAFKEYKIPNIGAGHNLNEAMEP